MLDRGVLPINPSDVEKFTKPTRNNEYNPELLDNMQEGYELLMKHLHGSRVLLVVDPDVDGYTSSAVVWLYMTKQLQGYKDFNFTLEYHIPEGKEHGLEVVIDELLPEKKYDLIICPDSSSNDYSFHEALKQAGYDILVLDHHEADHYSSDAVVINNQLSKNYPNKSLSGVGIVYKFFEYVEQQLNVEIMKEEEGEPLNFIEDYLDLVALGEISDVMIMTGLENRWICDQGLSHINNKFFKGLVEKQEYSLGEGELNQIGVAFYITPLINALIRVGSIYEKERLFQAFIAPDVEVDSTKRGEKGKKETICTQSIRNCVNAKARQTRERDKAAELLDIQIMDNCLDENKILILNADELNIPTTLTGLCAMGIAAKYKKPVLLGRLTSDGKLLRGSIRNKDGSPLRNLKDFLMESGQMEYVEG